MKVILYPKEGTTSKAEIHKFSYQGTFLGECFITAKIESEEPIDFQIGDYLFFRGERFVLNYIPAKQKQARKNSYGAAFVYDNVKFNSLSDELTRVEFLDVVLSDNKVHYTSLSDFSFYANDVKDLAGRIQANLDRAYSGADKWTVRVQPDAVSSDREIKISKKNCWEALTLANSEFGLNFIIRNRTITIGTAGVAVGKVFGYGKGKGLYDISQTANADARIITRLRAYASTRNIPHRYYNGLKDGNGKPYISESVYIPHLMLPSFPYIINDPAKVYLDSVTMAEYGLREGSVYFDGSQSELPEIFPSLEGMTKKQLHDAGINVSLKSGDNGNIDECLSADNPSDNGIVPVRGSISAYFTIYLKDLGFDLAAKDAGGQYKYAAAGTMQISMKSGFCTGRIFDVVENGIIQDTSLGYTRYAVKCKRFTDDNTGGGVTFPNNQYRIGSGDKFVILEIDMPDVYVKAAAQRLKIAAEDYLALHDSTKYTYVPKIDEIFMADNPQLGETIKEGDILNFDDTDLGIDASVIIQTLKINVGDKLVPTYDVTLSNEQVTGTLDKIRNSITQLITNNTGVTIEQVKSLILTLGTRHFLSRLNDDDAEGNLRLVQNLSVEKDLTVHGAVTGKTQVISNQFANDSFTSGQFGSGFRMWQNPIDGQSYAEFDNLMVRRETIFNVLTIAEIKSVGGQILVSAANMVCREAEETTDGYKCYFETDNDTIPNRFAVNDQAICRKFDGQNLKYYWRRVLSVGFDYILLSKTDADGNGIPAKGDDIIQFGNRTGQNRQSAIMISAYGSDAPSIKQYAGINSYDLTGKEVTAISPSGNKFTGTFSVRTGDNMVRVPADRGQWEVSTLYYYYDRVSYNGSLWLCVIPEGESTTALPSDASTHWQKETSGQAEINDAVDNIQIGGRNYALKTAGDIILVKPLTTFTQVVVNISSVLSDIITKEAYTISFDCYPHEVGKRPFSTFVVGKKAGDTWSYRLDYNNHFTKTANPDGSIKCRCTFTVDRPGGNTFPDPAWKNCRFLGELNDATIGCTVRNLKIEEGNKATDWTAAPEDTVQQIEDAANQVRQEYKADFTILDNRITSKVSQADFNTLQGRVSTSESKIEQQAGLISSAVERVEGKSSVYKSYTSGATDRPSVPYSKGDIWITYEGVIKQSQYTRVSGSFIDSDWKETTKYTDDTAINNLSIGGRNLITFARIGGTADSGRFADNTGRYNNISSSQWRIQNWTLSETGYYSVSFWAKANVAGTVTFDTCDQNSRNLALTTAWQFFKFENLNVTDYLGSPYYGFLDFNKGSSSITTLYLSNLKLEYGTKCTDYTRAPEDVEQERVQGLLYCRGTGLNRSANSILKLNDKFVYNGGSTRGLRLSVISRSDLAVLSDTVYDVYADAGARANLANALNVLNDAHIVVLTSYDAITIDSNLANAIARCGGSGTAINYRIPYAMVGIPNIGKGNGIEVYYSEAVSDPYAEITTKITDGVPQGINTTNGKALVEAESKNRTYYSDVEPSAPSGGHRVGDLWYKISLTDGCYLTYRWNGSLWQQINLYVSKSRIEQTDSRITSVVEKAGINSLGNTETLYSKINQTAEQIRLEVKNIQIGGRNLLLNSDFKRGLEHWYNNYATNTIVNDTVYGKVAQIVATNSYQGIYQNPSSRRVAGKTYTFSVFLKANNNMNVLLSHEGGAGNVTCNVTAQWQRFVGTGVWNGSGSMCFYALSAGTFYIATPQYEEGTKETAWSPAPEDVGSSLTLTDNKISLGSNTIELNGNTIAKAIQAQDLSVKTADGSSVFEVKNNGRFYSKSVSGNQSLEINSQSQFVEFKNNQPIYTETNGIKNVTQTTRIDAVEGRFVSSDSDHNTAYLSSQGILANRAGISPYSSATGISLKASVAGLGYGAMNQSYFSNWGLVGVFGRASNSNTTNPAPAYGGWFDVLKVNGLCYRVRRVSATTTLTQGDTYVSCYNTSEINLYLPSKPYEGTFIMVRRVNAGKIHIYGNGTQIHTDGSVHNDIWHKDGRGDTTLFIFDGNNWMMNYWVR